MAAEHAKIRKLPRKDVKENRNYTKIKANMYGAGGLDEKAVKRHSRSPGICSTYS